MTSCLRKFFIKNTFLNTILEQELRAPIKDVSFKPTDFILQGTSRLIQKSKPEI